MTSEIQVKSGRKKNTDPVKFTGKLAGKTLRNLEMLLDGGCTQTTLALSKQIWGTIPPPAIVLRKIESLDDAKEALQELIGMTARGEVHPEQADRLTRQILSYMEVGKVALVEARLDALETGKRDE